MPWRKFFKKEWSKAQILKKEEEKISELIFDGLKLERLLDYKFTMTQIELQEMKCEKTLYKLLF